MKEAEDINLYIFSTIFYRDINVTMCPYSGKAVQRL